MRHSIGKRHYSATFICSGCCVNVTRRGGQGWSGPRGAAARGPAPRTGAPADASACRKIHGQWARAVLAHAAIRAAFRACRRRVLTRDCAAERAGRFCPLA
jgi:hypothetical protein